MQTLERSFEYRDAPKPLRDIRDEGRVRIRVVCTPTHQVIPSGMLERGVNEVVVYRSDLEKIQAMVETEHQELEACKQVHQRNERRHYERYFNKPFEDVTEEERQRKPYGGSIQYEFRQRNGRDIEPLESLEILEELPPPDEAMQRPHNMVRELARAMAQEFVSATKQTTKAQQSKR